MLSIGLGLASVTGHGTRGEAAQIASQEPSAALASGPEIQVEFDIPAQPLSNALLAYGAATSLEVYYNAAVAQGRVSAAVAGTFTPDAALRMLLRGSGLTSQMTGPSALTVVPMTAAAPSPTADLSVSSGRYEGYFAAIQAGVADALCHGTDSSWANDGAIFRIWLTTSGVIDRADELVGSAHAASGRGFAGTIRGLAVGTPPPGMPQPITLAILPSSAGSQDCPPGAN
ncbi:hypothetical protein GCM10011611_43010 [Aliidongia dinghuensis]|uniref:Secretin/TonB short N-terminal domain-containing protein n=1 Tax=Aliidongia dinghuensis TaxID=1867774 RepID=A0A8J3E531_9PROT|nr:STN domain-containing protein [Aliidongia dinghuensis]GGF32216.1 hypothetical protein GCM10011611_43010 [Aliidongia dinghuensis]